MYHIFTYMPAGTEISYYLRSNMHVYCVALYNFFTSSNGSTVNLFKLVFLTKIKRIQGKQVFPQWGSVISYYRSSSNIAWEAGFRLFKAWITNKKHVKMFDYCRLLCVFLLCFFLESLAAPVLFHSDSINHVMCFNI